MDGSRRSFLAGVAATGFAADAVFGMATAPLTPEEFGAKGDSKTNDSAAFEALSAHVNAKGGGLVVLRPVTYLVGTERRSDGDPRFPFASPPILYFLNCTRPVTVRGNGARLLCAPSLRYGTFDRSTGKPTHHPLPFSNRSEVARPYLAMIRAEGCSGPIEISDIELDGNVGKLWVGGKYGYKGWQIAGSGIVLANNRGPERLARIHSHHHPLDGLTVYRVGQAGASTMVVDMRSEYNGRQGCSVTGGSNLAFERCRFSHTGKAALSSGPGAGVDIEAGRHPIRDVRFKACEFSDNSGLGVIADTGDTLGARFEDCTFVGTTSRSAWPNKPGFRFDRCLFVGSLVRAFGDPDPARAAQFHDCRFSDDPALSPTGQVFGGPRRVNPIAMLPDNGNVLFNRSRFELKDALVLPFSTRAVIYSDCTMSQNSPARARPYGTYRGSNRLSGNIDLGDSAIGGEVLLNGRPVPASG